jgi:hypothetical protein
MQTIETKNKPQIKVPRVTPLEGVYTYCFAIRGRGVEGTQSHASGGRVHVCPARAYVLFGSREPLGFGLENPQGFGIDERRFIESGIQRIFVDDIDSNLINSPQRTQSSQRFFMHLLSEFGNMLQQRLRTRMTRIRRIFTDNVDPCVSVSSVQSVFYYITSFTARASGLIIFHQKSEII